MNSIISKYLIYYPVVYLRRQKVPMYLKALRKSQWHRYEDIQTVQFQKLIKLLQYAKGNIPYYKKVLESVDISDFHSLDDISQVPILTKELLKQNFSQLSIQLKGAIKKTTGGSIGNPVTVYKSPESSGAALAAYWRGYEWAGVSIGDRQARFWGIPNDPKGRKLAKLTDIITNRYRCSAFSFDKLDMDRYYSDLNRFKPKYFYGYVSMLEAFAKYLVQSNLKLKFNLRCVITTSEVLTEPHKKLFAEAFDCPIYNEYGCGELGTIAHECEKGSMHITSENLLVEILNSNGKPAKYDETGTIVVSELNNFMMPMIRYNLGDLGCISQKTCECGRGLPILGEIVGRAYDIIYNREGKAFHGEYFMYIFEEIQNLGINISAFKVKQIDYDNFHLKLVMDKTEKEKVENYIIQRVHKTYGSYAKFSFDYVDRIEREKSGKIRLIESAVKR